MTNNQIPWLSRPRKQNSWIPWLSRFFPPMNPLLMLKWNKKESRSNQLGNNYLLVHSILAICVLFNILWWAKAVVEMLLPVFGEPLPLIPHIPGYLLSSMMNVYKFMPNLFCESKKSVLYCANECVLQLFLQFRLTIQNYTQRSEEIIPQNRLSQLWSAAWYVEQNQTFVNNCHWSICKHVSILEEKRKENSSPF